MSRMCSVCVCGAFGRFLNVSNAQDIDLLPDIDPQDVELWGCRTAFPMTASFEQYLRRLMNSVGVFNHRMTRMTRIFIKRSGKACLCRDTDSPDGKDKLCYF